MASNMKFDTSRQLDVLRARARRGKDEVVRHARKVQDHDERCVTVRTHRNDSVANRCDDVTVRHQYLVLATASLALVACGAAAEPSSEAAITSDVSTTTTPETTTIATTATTTSTTSTTTTIAVPTDPIALTTLSDLAKRGPHAVGVTTLTDATGLTVEVWYPTSGGATDTDAYDIRDFVPELVRNLLTGDVDAVFTYTASRDGDPDVAAGTPLVIFSHGYSGMRLQSATLTAHLASWGMVVAAPDHPSRDLMNTLGGTASGTPADSVNELLRTRELVMTDDRFSDVNATSWTAVGHSAGGATVARLADEGIAEGLSGIVSLAAGVSDDVGGLSVPAMFIAGSRDAVVPPTASRAGFELAPTGSALWVIDGAGHNAFDDFCRFGDGAGIIGVAEASGLGPLLDAQPQLRALGTDGCLEPAAPVTDSDPAIHAGATAYLAGLQGRRTFDPEETPPGPLTVEVATN